MHGAVSRQVRLLEEHLGRRLFRRTPNGAELTDDGEVLFSSSRDAFAILQGGVANLKRRGDEGTISLSLPTSLALKWLVPRLPAFRAAHPGYAVLLDTNDRLVDFRRETIDAALRFGTGGWSGVYAERLATEELVAVGSPQLVGDTTLPLSPEAIIDKPLLHDAYNPGWQRWFEMAGLTPSADQLRGDEFGDTGVLIEAAVDGQAAALVRHLLARDDLAAGRLVQVSDLKLPIDQSLFFVCRMGDQNRPALRLLRAWLRNRLARDDG